MPKLWIPRERRVGPEPAVVPHRSDHEILQKVAHENVKA
jgi:hypothetical protein